jgi:hypothetical protein
MLILFLLIGIIAGALFYYSKYKMQKKLDEKSAAIFEKYIKNVNNLSISECYLYKSDTIVSDRMLAIDHENKILCFVSYSDEGFKEKRYNFSYLTSSRVHESDTELSVIATFNDMECPSQVIVLQRAMISKLDKTDSEFIASRNLAEKINALFNAIITSCKAENAIKQV